MSPRALSLRGDDVGEGLFGSLRAGVVFTQDADKTEQNLFHQRLCGGVIAKLVERHRQIMHRLQGIRVFFAQHAAADCQHLFLLGRAQRRHRPSCFKLARQIIHRAQGMPGVLRPARGCCIASTCSSRVRAGGGIAQLL